jgi:hypothetical protein
LSEVWPPCWPFLYKTAKIRPQIYPASHLFIHRPVGNTDPARIFKRLWTMESRNRFQGMNSARLCSLAARYDNPIPTRFLAPISCLKILALTDLACSKGKKTISRLCPLNTQFIGFPSSVADPHHFAAHAGRTYHFEVDPDPDFHLMRIRFLIFI